MVGKFKALVEDLVGVTQHEVDKARGILKELVGGQIALHPAADGVDRYLTAELSGDYAGFVRLATGKNTFGGGHPQPALFCPTIRVPLRFSQSADRTSVQSL